MSSPFFSELNQLDGSLRIIQAQIDRLRSGMDDDQNQLKQSLSEACQHASALRNLVGAESADAKWSDREALEHLILALEIAADEKRIQQRRTKLLELASELEAGSLKHRSSARAESLNALRMKAVAQLRELAGRKEQDKELPGPQASEWVYWVCNLEEEKDAAALADLRENYSALDELAASIEESFWVPGQRAAVPPAAVETTVPKAAAAAPKTESPTAIKSESRATPATEAPAITKSVSPTTSTTELHATPVAKPASRVNAGRLPSEVKAHFDKAVKTGDLSEALSLCYDAPENEPVSAPQSVTPSEAKTPEPPLAVTASKEPLSAAEATPPPLKYCEQCGGTYPNRYKVCPIDGTALKDLPDMPSEVVSTAAAPVIAKSSASTESTAKAAGKDVGETKIGTATETAKPADDAAASRPAEDWMLQPIPDFEPQHSPGFSELVLTKTPVATWVAVGILVLLCAVFAWMHFRGSASAKAANAPPVATSSPDATAPKPLLHRDAAEGAQDNILLSMENCEHASSTGIECWGYISNQRDKDSKISLYRVNAIDGKGNSFDLSSKGKTTFSQVHDFTIPAQSKVKYSITVPDNDKEARTLTLYLDVANPHGSEYTFRDLPVAD